MAVEDVEQLVKAAIANKSHQIAEEGKELHKMLKDSADALKATKGVYIYTYIYIYREREREKDRDI